MSDPIPIPWPVGLLLLAFLLLPACANRFNPPPLPDDLGALSLLIERAVFATATQRCAECPACREDFQSAFDILDVMLDDPMMTLADLVQALSWMKVDKLSGPDGLLILTTDSVLIVSEGSGARGARPSEVEPMAMAVWVGLNKWFSAPPLIAQP